MKNRLLQNLAVLSITLFILLLLLEFFLRFYEVEFKIFVSNSGRKTKIHSNYDEFVSAAQKAGVGGKTFNIYFLGGSTMWGEPYGPFFSIPNIVDYRLGGSLGGKLVRSINFGSPGKDAAYVRYLAELLIQKKEVFHPSLIVIYTGHNEFFKFHPSESDLDFPGAKWLALHSELARQLFILLAGQGDVLEIDQRKFFDRDLFPFDPKGNEKVEKLYETHILTVIKEAQKSGIPLLISTLVSNYASCEPDRSVYCNSHEAQKQKGRFIQAFRHGFRAEKKQKYTTALKAYSEALSICDRFAEVNFRQGKVYQALHQYDRAWEAFQKALDYDGMPTNSLSYQNEFIQSLKRFEHVQIVDSLAYLRNHVPSGLLDENLTIDSIHPNLEGYLLIGEVISKKIHSSFASAKESLKPLDIPTAKKIFNIDSYKLFEVYIRVGRWDTKIATWHYDPNQRLKIAENFFRQAIEINPTAYEGYLGLAMISFLRRDVPKAESFLQKARTYDTKSVDDYLKLRWIQKILRRANYNFRTQI